MCYPKVTSEKRVSGYDFRNAYEIGISRQNGIPDRQ
jgi:hypothetical protein